MEILIGIFLFLTIVLLVIAIGALAIITYDMISDDLKERYRNWKNKKKQGRER